MKLNIFSKIFGGSLVIIVMLSLLLPIVFFRTIKTHYINTYKDNLKNMTLLLKPEIISMIKENRLKEIDAFIKSFKDNVNMRITFIDKEGVVIADSEKDPRTMENHKMRPEITDALSGVLGRSLRFSVTVEEEMLYVAMPVVIENKIYGVVRISTFLKDINRLLYDIRVKILWFAVIITIIAIIMAFILSRGISNPVKKLVLAAENISKGDFGTRIFLRNNDELKMLADSFNNMAVNMQNIFVNIAQQNEEFNTIISSIEEPLVVLKKDDKIKLCNESFKKLIENQDPAESFLWENIRSPELNDLIKKTKADKKNLTAELRLKDKTFLCSLTFLSTKEEIVLILHDISDLKKLEMIKKDFVANMSHEIRTPLTAIKGFIETLEEEEQVGNPYYLAAIKRHTDRLMNIVNDLLVLSELEETTTDIVVEEVSLAGLTENILKIFEKRVREKGLRLNVEIDKSTPLIMGDSFKLEQMLINLVDNAIKYTEEGSINIMIRPENHYVNIEVQDTGIGIPEIHLPRIFERFYTVDKSRSKKLGGTGLGLSIVKHIVQLHHGVINVESSLGKGTRFTVKIPCNISS